MTAPRVHHLNCGTMCPPSRRFVQGRGGWLESACMVCHCLLIERDGGLVLVDTGMGLLDVTRPATLGMPFVAVVRPQLKPEGTAIRQIEALGFQASDVRDIVCTHLDLDHAGGLPDFPQARVHVLRDEHEAAMHATGLHAMRYVAAHWRHDVRWAPHDADGEDWFGFRSVRALPGDGDVLLVPVAGHSRGHAAVAVRTADGWLLHCGDAYFAASEMAAVPTCPPGLRLFQRIVQADGPQRLANQARLRQLRREHAQVRLFCSHDPEELRAAQQARA